MTRLSREVEAIIAYLDSTGLPYRVTSTTGGRHAESSRHFQEGTDGKGLAVDFAGPRPMDIPAMLRIYRALLGEYGRLHELIFWVPGEVKILVRRRTKVVPTVYGTKVLEAHRSHVHVSTYLGTFLESRRRSLSANLPSAATDSVGPQGPVHDWEDRVKTTLLTITLDDHGDGWADWDPALGRDPIPVAVLKQGPSPPEDGYWPEGANLDLSAQPRDGKLRVTARLGPPGGKATAWVTVA
jgi:hypothetical protein